MHASARCWRRSPRFVKPEVLDGTYRLPDTDGSGDNRANLQAATSCSREAGYRAQGRAPDERRLSG